MKAVILAGGEGSRLRPLTCDLPKPMARLCGRPAVEHIIDLLSRNGVDEAAVTLRYLPKAIKDNFPSGTFRGVKLRFVTEDEPLGTAGGVARAAEGFDEDFLVISGDAMCDFNLAAAMRFHREKGADATLVLSRVKDPREYGLVVTEAAGKVSGFVEKPGWPQAVTDAVNTGIYIIGKNALSLIPHSGAFDFAKDLFPLMMRRGMKVFGFEADGYWCDIGDIGAYTSCQFDMLERRVDCRIEGLYQNGIYHKGTIPTGKISITPPVYIGENVKIGDYSKIGPFAVIDDGCTIGFGANVRNSIVLQDAYIGAHCELRGALVCHGASLKRRAGMFEGSVAGAGSVIGADASVSPGVRIWPGKRVEDGARAAVNIKTGSARRGIFDDEGITGEVGAELTPENCALIGAAAGSVFKRGRIGVGCDGSVAGKNLKYAAAAGVLSTGAEVCDFGSGFDSLFNFAVGFLDLDMGIFVRQSGERAVIELVGQGGLSVGRSAERKIEAAVSTGEIARCGADEYRAPFSMPGIAAVYRSELLKNAPKGFPVPIEIKSPNREIKKLLSQVLRESGCLAPESGNAALRVHIDAYGRKASFFCEDGSFLDAEKTLALGCAAAFAAGEDVALPYDAPAAITQIAERFGKKVLRYLDCPADKSDEDARKLAQRETFVRDGLENALRVLSFANSQGKTLCELKKILPEFAVTVKAVGCTVNPGLLLNSLSKGAPSQPSDGVILTRKNGTVRVCPMKRGTGVKIFAEAGDMEAAGELCDEVMHELQNSAQALDNPGEKS